MIVPIVSWDFYGHPAVASVLDAAFPIMSSRSRSWERGSQFSEGQRLASRQSCSWTLAYSTSIHDSL